MADYSQCKTSEEIFVLTELDWQDISQELLDQLFEEFHVRINSVEKLNSQSMNRKNLLSRPFSMETPKDFKFLLNIMIEEKK